jgi:hypothetical protein
VRRRSSWLKNKVKQLEFKEKFGYAEVDGQKQSANWTAEPSCLFAGEGACKRTRRVKRARYHYELA